VKKLALTNRGGYDIIANDIIQERFFYEKITLLRRILFDVYLLAFC
jgi:hypothetical protein